MKIQQSKGGIKHPIVKKEREDNCVREKWKRKNKNKKNGSPRIYQDSVFDIFDTVKKISIK